jgi:hypothetical protein
MRNALFGAPVNLKNEENTEEICVKEVSELPPDAVLG